MLFIVRLIDQLYGDMDELKIWDVALSPEGGRALQRAAVMAFGLLALG